MLRLSFCKICLTHLSLMSAIHGYLQIPTLYSKKDALLVRSEYISTIETLNGVIRMGYYIRVDPNVNIYVEDINPCGCKTILSHDHHFKWWFAISPIRADYLLRLKGGYRKHCYHRPLKEAPLVHFFFFGFFLLFLYISLNCFLRDISHGCYIIASCPKRSVPLTPLIWMCIIYH